MLSGKIALKISTIIIIIKTIDKITRIVEFIFLILNQKFKTILAL